MVSKMGILNSRAGRGGGKYTLLAYCAGGGCQQNVFPTNKYYPDGHEKYNIFHLIIISAGDGGGHSENEWKKTSGNNQFQEKLSGGGRCRRCAEKRGRGRGSCGQKPGEGPESEDIVLE